jgi:hypothetical protein
MPCRHPTPIRMGMLAAALLALAACEHVGNVLENTGEALKRHSEGGNSSPAGGGTQSSTPGQNSGGASKEQLDAVYAAFKAAREECKASMASPELDPIRHKVELMRDIGGQPLPFEIATNNNFPSAEDRPVIAKWASLRDECIRRLDEVQLVPPGANATQTAMLNQLRAFSHQAVSDVTDLTICLYQQKLTYAEFGRKINEIGKADAAFTLATQQASATGNSLQQQLQDLQTAQQQFTDTLDGFSKYVRTVSARKPKTVRVSGAGN